MMSRIIVAIALLCASALVHADFLGAASGRSANPANSPKLSIEGTLNNGSGYRYIGARINYNVNDKVTAYGDFGQADIFGDGVSFGGGVFYYLPGVSESMSFMNNMDAAVQASLHIADLFVDYTAITAALLVSPKTPLANGMYWYANAGLFNVNSGSGVPGPGGFELQVGGGISLPLGPGTLFAGLDRIGQFTASVGYRFAL